MKNRSFLSTLVHVCRSRAVARLALLAVPISLLARANSTAYGTGVAGFSTSPTSLTYPGDTNYATHTGGLTGALISARSGSNISGVSFTTNTGGALVQNQAAGTLPLTSGALTAFSLSGSVAGTTIAATNTFVGHYHFTLADSATLPSTVVITGWTLTDAINGTLTGNASATSLAIVPATSPQTFDGNITFALGTGTTLSTYSSTLTISYTVTGTGTSITTTVPTGSIDFEVAPEPGTWAIVGLGIAGAAIQGIRPRRCRVA